VPRLRPTRLLAIGGLTLLVFLYWKPTQTYFRTKQQLDIRRSEVHQLRDERSHLQKQIALAGTSEQLVREARRLGLVKPGERLFIVKGISAWRKHH
jgi:cell division protein FtsB